jgi:hypothetical protein
MGEALCAYERLDAPVYVGAAFGLHVGSGGATVPCLRATSFADRLRGLLGTDRGYLRGGALLIEDCSSVHTFGMRYAIDVAFLDGLGRVVAVREAMVPGRVFSCRGAAAALEREHADAPWFEEGDEVRFVVDPDGRELP